jgi:hypothetical protein
MNFLVVREHTGSLLDCLVFLTSQADVSSDDMYGVESDAS